MPPKKNKKFVNLPLDTAYLAPPSVAVYSASPTTKKSTTTASSSTSVKLTPLIKPKFFPNINSGIQKIIGNYNADKKRLVPEDATKKKWVLSNWHSKRPSPELALSGTVKLHGVHIDLVFDNPKSNVFRIQSRNVAHLDASNDIYEVVATLRNSEMEAAVIDIRDLFLTKYTELNPGIKFDETKPLIIAGEWVGPGVYKSVALAQFPAKAFVLLNFHINDSWIPTMAPYSDIHAQNLGILNICLGGFFKVSLLIDKPQACFDEVERLTLSVERECPFAKAVGQLVGSNISGIGEGIVWRLASPSDARETSERYWVKTKGPLHADVEKTKLPATFDAPARERAKAFALATVREARLEGRWVELLGLCGGDGGGKPDATKTGKFMNMLVKDVEREEAKEMKRLDINVIEVRKQINVIGKAWFQARLKSLA